MKTHYMRLPIALAAFARSYAAPIAVLTVVLVTIASFVASVLADPANSGPNFFLTQLRVWELGCGILAALCEGRVRQFMGRGAEAAALSTFAVLLGLPFLPLSSLTHCHDVNLAVTRTDDCPAILYQPWVMRIGGVDGAQELATSTTRRK